LCGHDEVSVGCFASYDFAIAAKALSPPARPAQAIDTQVQFFVVIVVDISVSIGGASTEEGGKR
jgi:hypothetical protein